MERAQLFKSFASDNKNLDVQFRAAKIRLQIWGRAMGFHDGKRFDEHHPALDEEKTGRAAVEVFDLVRNIHDPSDAGKSRLLRATAGNMSVGSQRALLLPGATNESK